jgi:hypothetical protein
MSREKLLLSWRKDERPYLMMSFEVLFGKFWVESIEKVGGHLKGRPRRYRGGKGRLRRYRGGRSKNQDDLWKAR